MTNPYSDPEREAFQVGGIDRDMSEEEQLEQLASYIHAHYEAPEKNPPWSDNPSDPLPADTFDAMLPDRLTHSSMLMLGAAVNHAMPGVAFIDGITVEDLPELNAKIFRPSQPSGAWAISLHPGGWWKGSGVALENAWRPEVAGLAELSGVTIVDLDYPLLPESDLPAVIAAVTQAAEWIRSQGAPWVGAWGYSSGGALAVLCAELFDALALTFPHLELDGLPEDIRGGTDFPALDTLPTTFMQIASHDSIAGHYPWFEEASAVRTQVYTSEHRVSTPTVARQRVRDIAEFFRSNYAHES
ncbi:alpha/beta hydrolase [Corynebacterium sp. ES2794-CONJ1]|uniref:alpha/beta hydrolase n=1 Tax=unclassified Corynebacterium TaxID=2624378 RepID=UPI0021694D0B|nr:MULTISPECIES: alpha/beta hydrolase [unclassified Corynebacterium]MCS4490390.1 alpha/beta hydrolase [Corynebacterium sp. ES2775-CONJ]MCS4492170.1 alpha/beta hydrolase [Corynebacterium sp. ES2715-CONJ3]MCS4532348.1 alpha/beta hydrolase [Corynebacterium sp. ES2730-CONJ]MCU9519689.1 alpha/beta hydrolase [Corynebacterium sp. ES2794-CONJ1]